MMSLRVSCVLIVSLAFLGALMPLGVQGEEKRGGTRDKRACLLTCQLTPQSEEGPYYYNSSLFRTNITEDREGVRVRYIFTVVDVATCTPISNAAVDIWTADALGIYSAFNDSDNPAASGSTYLRGIQTTDNSGTAYFDSIFPGYICGRDTHAHVKVRLNGLQPNSTTYVGGYTYYTGQIFFNNTISDLINAMSPYNTNPHARTQLEDDDVYVNQNGTIAQVVPMDGGDSYESGMLIYITLGVNSTAGEESAIKSSGAVELSPLFALGLVVALLAMSFM